jgi:hypothetical protein
MGVQKCVTWPRVLVNDDGIRAVPGRENECYYCAGAVGEEHRRDCVCLLKLVRYSVLIHEPGSERRTSGEVVGTYDSYDVWHWSEHNGEFHKNDSSWCADNAIDDIQWTDKCAHDLALAFCDEDSQSCCCAILEFRFDQVLDPGPLVVIREEQP